MSEGSSYGMFFKSEKNEKQLNVISATVTTAGTTECISATIEMKSCIPVARFTGRRPMNSAYKEQSSGIHRRAGNLSVSLLILKMLRGLCATFNRFKMECGYV